MGAASTEAIYREEVTIALLGSRILVGLDNQRAHLGCCLGAKVAEPVVLQLDKHET